MARQYPVSATLAHPIFDKAGNVVGSLAPVFVIRLPVGSILEAPFSGAVTSVIPDAADGSSIVSFTSPSGMTLWMTNVKLDDPNIGEVDPPTHDGKRWAYIDAGKRIGTTVRPETWMWYKSPGGENQDPAQINMIDGTPLFIMKIPNLAAKSVTKPAASNAASATPASNNSAESLALLGIALAVYHNRNSLKKRSRR